MLLGVLFGIPPRVFRNHPPRILPAVHSAIIPRVPMEISPVIHSENHLRKPSGFRPKVCFFFPKILSGIPWEISPGVSLGTSPRFLSKISPRTYLASLPEVSAGNFPGVLSRNLSTTQFLNALES